MRGKSCYHFQMGQRFNSAIAIMKRMFRFIRAANSTTWLLMRPGSGARECSVKYWGPIVLQERELRRGQSSQGILVVLVTLGSNGFSSRKDIMIGSNHKIIHLSRLWWTTMKLLWPMTQSMLESSNQSPMKH